MLEENMFDILSVPLNAFDQGYQAEEEKEVGEVDEVNIRVYSAGMWERLCLTKSKLHNRFVVYRKCVLRYELELLLYNTTLLFIFIWSKE
jgi:hypothetical protein